MTNCAKCGAELIGSRKFCAACGAPAVDPATLKRDASVAGPPSAPAPQINVPSTAYGPPNQSQVNPFASTASPASRAPGSAPSPSVAYGPPPSPAQPQAPSQVSPLAVSNALSQRGAFQQAAAAALSGEVTKRSGTGTSPPPPPSVPAPQAQAPKRIPGTQLMPSVPHPPSAPPAQPAPPTAPGPMRPPERTQLMDASQFARPNPAAPVPTPAPVPVPPSLVQPPAPVPPPPPHAHAPVQPQPPAWGWSAPAPPSPYGFGYAPGARVNVTWSNGQRYPATVHQVSGTQCLVVFPDGQQHWVEMQYLTPG